MGHQRQNSTYVRRLKSRKVQNSSHSGLRTIVLLAIGLYKNMRKHVRNKGTDNNTARPTKFDLTKRFLFTLESLLPKQSKRVLVSFWLKSLC